MALVVLDTKLVKTVTIGGVPFNVYLADEIDNDGSDALGYLSYENQCIYVKRVAKETRQVSLLHEIIHAAAVNGGINLAEEIVISLSQSLFDVLTRNPNLFEGLEDKDDE